MTTVLSIFTPNDFMKPVIKDTTVLRLQEATGLPISRGVDKSINAMLDQLDSFKDKSLETTDSKSDETSIECQCDTVKDGRVNNQEEK